MPVMTLLIIAFIMLTVMPLVGAALFYKCTKGSILHINQNRDRDPRYFGTSFSEMIQKELPKAKNHKIFLSKEEEFLTVDMLKNDDEVIDKLVICTEEEFCVSSSAKAFQKEIYCSNSAVLGIEGTVVRAVYANNKMILGNGVSVVRWVDSGQTLAVYNDCDLGVSATAGERLSVGVDCTFKRLYAPEICIGQFPNREYAPWAEIDHKIFQLPVQEEHTVISREDVKVLENHILQGDIRSYGSVVLYDKAVVCGNIFAEKNVHIGKNAVVLGNIFCQGSIHIEEKAMVGRKGKISSVVARENITIEPDCVVYGLISCEDSGRTTTGVRKKEEMTVKLEDFAYLKEAKYLQFLSFETLTEYENTDSLGFRKEKELKEVVLPTNASSVPKSMFFECKALEKVLLPKSLKEIGDYAFADCDRLNVLQGIQLTCLESVGISAFENCKVIEHIEFPRTMKCLGGAAFGGCVSLKRVVFAPDAVLESIGDHCFCGCKSIEEIELPDTVKYVGISAFKDCIGLKRVSIPQNCVHQPGVVELQAINSKVELIIRSLKGGGDVCEGAVS